VASTRTLARTLVVGTRGSQLALTQTAFVIDALRAMHPGLDVGVQRITTKGDAIRDVPLAVLGGGGVFVDAIEKALREKEIDLAVHSAKDLPSRVPPDLAIAAFLERADPRDVLVSRAGTLAELPLGARVGTSSVRRVSALRALRPDLETPDLRGNVDTRLRKLDAGDYDAIVLAGAGLVRLGLETRVSEWLSVETMLPSPGQGALAVEIRADDAEVRELVRPLAHQPTVIALTAERGFLARLGAGCAAAVGGYGTVDAEGQVTLRAMIGAPDGRSVKGTETGASASAEAIGVRLADRLLASGGREIAAEGQRSSVA
jgi:hydroxymethylbilane synthase